MSDVTPAPPHARKGTVRAALSHRDFRIMWLGSFGSYVGTWMQNVLLPPFAYKLAERTGGISPGAYSGLIIVAQLAPLLLSPLAGMLGDRFPRRPLLIMCQLEQLVFSLVLALLVAGEPSKLALFLVVLAIGIGNSINLPIWSATIPTLVPFRDLPGAISLNSTMVNGSRVIGPLLVVVLRDTFGLTVPGVFVVNAATYLFVIGALVLVNPGRAPADDSAEPFVRRFVAGVTEARRNKIIGRLLLIVAVFSLVSLPYIGQFQTVAEQGLGIDSDATSYRWLYATWALGACLGGLAIGTVFARFDTRRLPRVFLGGFAIWLFVLSRLADPGLAFVVVFGLGFCYFAITTSMMTLLQQHVDARVRSRVLALWFVCFGGTIPIGAGVGGWLMDVWGVTPVLTIGAIGAALLAPLAAFKAIDERAAAHDERVVDLPVFD